MIRLGFCVPSPSKKRKTKERRGKAAVSASSEQLVRSETTDLEEHLEVEGASQRATVLMTAYRFLDPNGDGAVTAKEFSFLQGIWRELWQSTWEFVELVRELFGSVEAAWSFADVDGSGAIDFEEFQQLAERWHFQGSLRQIFLFLAKGGKDTVGRQEWLSLQQITRPDI